MPRSFCVGLLFWITEPVSDRQQRDGMLHVGRRLEFFLDALCYVVAAEGAVTRNKIWLLGMNCS